MVWLFKLLGRYNSMESKLSVKQFNLLLVEERIPFHSFCNTSLSFPRWGRLAGSPCYGHHQLFLDELRTRSGRPSARCSDLPRASSSKIGGEDDDDGWMAVVWYHSATLLLPTHSVQTKNEDNNSVDSVLRFDTTTTTSWCSSFDDTTSRSKSALDINNDNNIVNMPSLSE